LYFDDPTNAPKSPEQRERRQAFLQAIQQTMQQAMELNVKMALGFDASDPDSQGKNALELVAMTKRGMPALAAIRAATVNAAEHRGWQDRVGAIEPGKYADLVAVEGDPPEQYRVVAKTSRS